MRKWLLFWGGLLCSVALWAAEATVLVLQVSGEASVDAVGYPPRVLLPFSRVMVGDTVNLGADSQVTLVYAATGRREAWSGAGSFAVGEGESRKLRGKSSVEIRQLPAQVAQQMLRTPSLDGEGKVGMVRLRAIAPTDALARLEARYQELRNQMPPQDSEPEVFLLSGLFELGEFERLEQQLSAVEKRFVGDSSIKVLKSLYLRAINNARQAKR
ncbi:MAG: hypothetical protein RIR00_227 [Pseudomonadota bacterium]|jgi:hypothetical protein